MLPLIDPTALNADALIIFYGWSAHARRTQLPRSEQEYPDDEILSRIWSTIGTVPVLDGTYSAGGAWQTQRMEAVHSSPQDYIEDKERLLRELLDDSQLADYDSAVIFCTFRQEVRDVRKDKGGIIVGSCFFVYKRDRPRGGGEELPRVA